MENDKKTMHSISLNVNEETMLKYLMNKGMTIKGIFKEGLTYFYKVIKEGEQHER